MKKRFDFVISMLSKVILCTLLFCLAGCGYFGQPGETVAEGHRRHLRNLSINQQNMISDVDRVILADQPSKATPKKTE